ncbi:MAG: argininosuccinate synthase, partial [Promethearchaeota archaeon]
TELVYEGLWVDPLRDSLQAFIDEINKKVIGSVKLKLFKGSANVIARESPYGIYDLNLASYDAESSFDQKLSYGFIPLWGLQSRMGFITKKKLEKDKKNKI